MDIKKLNLDDLINPNNNKSDDEKQELDPNSLIKLITTNHLLSKDNLKSNSRVKMEQVSDLSRMYIYADMFEIPFIKSLADNILNLQISVNGLGRKELVDLIGKVYNDFPELQQENSIKRTNKEVFR